MTHRKIDEEDDDGVVIEMGVIPPPPKKKPKRDPTANTEMYPITLEMCKILYDWLFEVNSKYFQDPEDVYLHCVQICSAYFDRTDHKVLRYQDVQCAGCAAHWIAHKLESWDDLAHSLKDYVYLSNNAFSSDELIAMEKKICKNLEYNFYNLP